MKKILAAFTAATLAAAGCAVAFAESREVVPSHEVDMETYGNEDCTVSAEINSVDEQNCLIYLIYDKDMYATEDIASLQAGDTLQINGDEMTVNTAEAVDGGYDINGGFGEGGASLGYVDGDPDHLYSYTYNDAASKTLLGQAGYLLAEQVTIRTYHMNEDGNVSDADDEVQLPREEVADYLAAKAEEGIVFGADNCTIRLVNGEVVEIDAVWTPYL